MLVHQVCLSPLRGQVEPGRPGDRRQALSNEMHRQPADADEQDEDNAQRQSS